MAKEGFKNAAIREPLWNEALRVLKMHPWLGPPFVGTLLDRLLQNWLEDAHRRIREREASLEDDERSTPSDPGEDYAPRR